ncbi:RNA 2',3'-cyclic phosphodiesterase [Paenibacillus sepulcri]|uniref:RNA 2',3'-cyclic phosphodiesterase n=1 Tax=Paenibacillus sepulcri TaxID=359917 RepID=UPI00360642B5
MTTPTTAPTKESQRLFIAVPLPDSLKRLIGAWTRDIRTSFPFRKWTDEADLHVTLQFLGDTAPVLIPELKAALASAAGSGRIQPFTLSLRDTRTFGRPGQPSVLWAGIGGELEQLHSLQRMIVEATAPLGFAAEKTPLQPPSHHRP